nr:MAG TPA: hypothetical protein [Caudoviricetes sp.]
MRASNGDTPPRPINAPCHCRLRAAFLRPAVVKDSLTTELVRKS